MNHQELPKQSMTTICMFLAATKQLYEWFSPSVHHTFLTMFPSSYHHEIFRSYYQWQKWSPCKWSRSKVKVTTPLNRFLTVTPVWIHIWWWNDAYSLMLLRRGALLLLISSYTNGIFRLSVCLSVTPFWLCSHHRIIMKFSGVITNDQSKVHALLFFKVIRQISRSHTIVEFDPNWVFPDCNSSLNSPMAMKCCTKLETAKERCPIVFQGHP